MVEKFLIWVAWHLPRSLAYWVGVRVLTDKEGEVSDEKIETLRKFRLSG